MKIEHYSFCTGGRHAWRWRIRDDDGDIVCQGVKSHNDRDQSQAELNEVLDFLEAWSRERVQHGAWR